MVAGSDCRSLDSVTDQFSTDICDVVQASESDLMARGVAIDLLHVTKQVGPQYEDDEYEGLSGKENLPLDRVVEDD